MAQERLHQLQELSKGKEIIDVNFPSINVSQLMRETQAGTQPQTWEVYAKKVIGPDIIIIKRFTSDGQVSVVERKGSVLSTGQYPLEDGEKYFGEGYLQIEPRQNYRSYIKDIELVGLAQFGSPSTSPGLADEFKSWVEEANPTPLVQPRSTIAPIRSVDLYDPKGKPMSEPGISWAGYGNLTDSPKPVKQKPLSVPVVNQNEDMWEGYSGLIDKQPTVNSVSAQVKPDKNIPPDADRANPILLAGLSQRNAELRVLRAQLDSQKEDYDGQINDLQAEIAALSLALEAKEAANSGAQVLPGEPEAEEILDDSTDQDEASVAAKAAAVKVVSRGPILPSYVSQPTAEATIQDPEQAAVAVAGEEEPEVLGTVAVADAGKDLVSVAPIVDITRPYDIETDGKHLNGVNGNGNGNGNGKHGVDILNGRPHIVWENDRKHPVAATVTAIGVLEHAEEVEASVIDPDLEEAFVVDSETDLDIAPESVASVKDLTLWEEYESNLRGIETDAELLDVNEVENSIPEIETLESEDLEDMPWPGLSGIDDVNPVLKSTVLETSETVVIPESREIRIRLPKLPLEGIHSHDRSRPEVSGARNFEIAIESLPSRKSLGVNQDVVLFDTSDKTLFGLSDGVRASNGAQRAADLTALVMKERISEIPSDSHPDDAKRLMEDALIEANNRIIGQQLENSDFSDMQATGSYIKLITRGIANWIVWGNVGDSRIAILRNGKIIELTNDDEERLGKSREIKPKTGKFRLRSTDKVLFYTNGIHKRLSTEAIEKVLYKRSNLGIMAEEVMKLAKYQSDGEDRDSTMAILRLLQSK